MGISRPGLLSPRFLSCNYDRAGLTPGVLGPECGRV